MNVCPTVGQVGDRMFAIGASGGRKILPAVANLVSFMVDFGMDLEQAFHTSRIDASAVPAGVMRQAGRNCGATEIMSPWGDAVCEADV